MRAAAFPLPSPPRNVLRGIAALAALLVLPGCSSSPASGDAEGDAAADAAADEPALEDGPAEDAAAGDVADGEADADARIPVSGLAVAPTWLLLRAGDARPIVATVTPLDATDPSVRWTSADTSVARVDAAGTATGVLAGRTSITATTNDGGFSANAEVLVVPAEIGGCTLPDPDDIMSFPDCPGGGGIFGRWIVDGEGMPAFLYEFDQLHDPRSPWPNSEDIAPAFRERRDHFVVSGNRRLNFMAVDDGIVSVFADDRGPAWLNRFDEAQLNLGGGFSYLRDDDSGDVWASAYRYAPAGATTRRVFGVGYFETETTHDGIAVRHRIIAPAGDFGDDPLVVDDVELRNESASTRRLAHYEYWDVNRHQLQIQWLRTGLAAAPGDDARDQLNGRFLQQVSWDAARRALRATMTPKPSETPAARDEVSAIDWHPPEIFLAALVGDATERFSDQRTFFGTGSAAAPGAVAGELPGGELPAVDALGQPACLVLRSDITLAPGETRRLRFAHGYLPAGADLDALLARHADPAIDPLRASLEAWRPALAYAALPDLPLAHRETAWRSHLLLANTLFHEYYDTHLTPQGSAYLYLHGADGAPRDQALFAAPLSYLDPALARDNLTLVMELTDATTGAISYSFTGYGVNEGAAIHERPSDLDIFFLFALAEYLAATGDRAFLDQHVPFHPRDAGHPARVADDTVLDHVRNAFLHLRDDVGLGPHGLVRIQDGDWSDGIVYEDLSPLAIAFTQANGESVPNSQVAVVVLPLLAAQLESLDAALAADLRAFAAGLEAPVRSTFGSRWFGRAWLRNSFDQAYLKGTDAASDPFAANFIDLEAQPWGLLAGLLDEAQRERVLDEVEARLDADSAAGPRLREGGQVWPAISQLMTWAYARFRPASAWRSLAEHLYARHAESWPEQWIGIWSGPDGFSSSGSDGGTWASPLTPMTDFPVANMNPEAMWLFGLLRTAGVEPVADGLSIRPPGGGPEAYTIQLPLLRVEVTPRRIGGRYRAANDGSIVLHVAVPDGATPVARIDGGSVAADVIDGAVALPLVFLRGQELEFAVEW
ncbi:MAG: Ig-like domain-containing protein [Deltaproteobacteria bacterium]|nr:Ig-like domain-containing protein [Deltaproteobacteria bacterium]